MNSLRSQMFRQIAQRCRRHTVDRHGCFVQDDGNYASKLWAKVQAGKWISADLRITIFCETKQGYLSRRTYTGIDILVYI